MQGARTYLPSFPATAARRKLNWMLQQITHSCDLRIQMIVSVRCLFRLSIPRPRHTGFRPALRSIVFPRSLHRDVSSLRSRKALAANYYFMIRLENLTWDLQFQV
ncbi:hypothetical protein TNIN_357961 [Trichonephila inaurata madagascariensis]|uniref:Uncharacterized protein n=1 Tax=Trichonephila inaurata madagascariensis TaxID=2747483 RepID=A0A8X6MKL4_9ARAC|nr:hypothetical protein TNIN_357961 [Trichonephila inaurata madagascariensis]